MDSTKNGHRKTERERQAGKKTIIGRNKKNRVSEGFFPKGRWQPRTRRKYSESDLSWGWMVNSEASLENQSRNRGRGSARGRGRGSGEGSGRGWGRERWTDSKERNVHEEDSEAAQPNALNVIVRKHVMDKEPEADSEAGKRNIRRRRRHAYYCKKKCWDPRHCVHPWILLPVVLILMIFVFGVVVILYIYFGTGCSGRCNDCPCIPSPIPFGQYSCECPQNRTGKECQFLNPCKYRRVPCSTPDLKCVPNKDNPGYSCVDSKEAPRFLGLNLTQVDEEQEEKEDKGRESMNCTLKLMNNRTSLNLTQKEEEEEKKEEGRKSLNWKTKLMNNWTSEFDFL